MTFFQFEIKIVLSKTGTKPINTLSLYIKPKELNFFYANSRQAGSNLINKLDPPWVNWGLNWTFCRLPGSTGLLGILFSATKSGYRLLGVISFHV